jgi:hypothetical protein
LGKIEGFAAFAVLELNVLISGEVRDIFERFFGGMEAPGSYKVINVSPKKNWIDKHF